MIYQRGAGLGDEQLTLSWVYRDINPEHLGEKRSPRPCGVDHRFCDNATPTGYHRTDPLPIATIATTSVRVPTVAPSGSAARMNAMARR